MRFPGRRHVSTAGQRAAIGETNGCLALRHLCILAEKDLCTLAENELCTFSRKLTALTRNGLSPRTWG
jgi:phage FluMu protein gp41